MKEEARRENKGSGNVKMTETLTSKIWRGQNILHEKLHIYQLLLFKKEKYKKIKK